MSDIKKEIEAMAIAAVECPTCGAHTKARCRKTVADDKGRHVPTKTHQRRMSAFIANHMTGAFKEN